MKEVLKSVLIRVLPILVIVFSIWFVAKTIPIGEWIRSFKNSASSINVISQETVAKVEAERFRGDLRVFEMDTEGSLVHKCNEKTFFVMNNVHLGIYTLKATVEFYTPLDSMEVSVMGNDNSILVVNLPSIRYRISSQNDGTFTHEGDAEFWGEEGKPIVDSMRNEAREYIRKTYVTDRNISRAENHAIEIIKNMVGKFNINPNNVVINFGGRGLRMPKAD